MMWEFATAGRILFGPGTRRQMATAARGLGSRALLVTGRHLADESVWAGLEIDLDLRSATRFVVEGEPTIDLVREGVRAYVASQCDFVIGIGGGSVLDAGKAIAALATNPGDPLDYLEVIGSGRPLSATPAPCMAVPTTAGTGSEVTRNAVLGSPEHRRKASLRHVAMLPRVAIIDPELTLTSPPAITASTGLDALTQVIEPYVSSRATPMTDVLCLEGIRRISRSLRTAVASPDDLDARTDMSYASLLGGLALANAGLGIVHGCAGPIGGMFPAPHGAVCAALLPYGIEENFRALHARAPQHPAIDRYHHVAAAFTGSANATAGHLINAIEALCADLHIPRLRTYGIRPEHVEDIAREAQRASSMKANPIELTDAEVQAVIRAAC